MLLPIVPRVINRPRIFNLNHWALNVSTVTKTTIWQLNRPTINNRRIPPIALNAMELRRRAGLLPVSNMDFSRLPVDTRLIALNAINPGAIRKFRMNALPVTKKIIIQPPIPTTNKQVFQLPVLNATRPTRDGVHHILKIMMPFIFRFIPEFIKVNGITAPIAIPTITIHHLAVLTVMNIRNQKWMMIIKG